MWAPTDQAGETDAERVLRWVRELLHEHGHKADLEARIVAARSPAERHHWSWALHTISQARWREAADELAAALELWKPRPCSVVEERDHGRLQALLRAVQGMAEQQSARGRDPAPAT